MAESDLDSGDETLNGVAERESAAAPEKETTKLLAGATTSKHWTWNPLSSYSFDVFDDNIENFRRLFVVVYTLVVPATAYVTYLLTPESPTRHYPAIFVFLLCTSALASAFLTSSIDSYLICYAVGVVPVVCCGIASAVTGQSGVGFMAILAAPVAWSSVILGTKVIVSACVTAVLTVFVVVVYETGEIGPALMSATVVLLVHPLIGWVGQGKSERLRANQLELRASQEKFNLAFEGSQDAIFLSSDDSAYTFLEVNAGFERLTGYKREEILGKRTRDMNLFADLDEHKKYLATYLAHGEVTGLRCLYRHRDGTVFWGESSSSPLLLGGKKVLLTTTRDVTAQQNYESMLVEARKLAEASARAKAEFLANCSHGELFGGGL
jgi:PAS domain S-box-containing protein